MLDAVIDALVGVLTEGEVNAQRCFPEAGADYSKDCVCVDAKSCRSLSAGFADYVGVRTKADGSETELYGKRLELAAGIEVYSPTAKGCTVLADRVSKLLTALPEGLKAIGLERGEVSFDNRLGAFHCGCVLTCTAVFVAESGGDDGEFLDFILKGSVLNAG